MLSCTQRGWRRITGSQASASSRWSSIHGPSKSVTSWQMIMNSSQAENGRLERCPVALENHVADDQPPRPTREEEEDREHDQGDGGQHDVPGHRRLVVSLAVLHLVTKPLTTACRLPLPCWSAFRYAVSRSSALNSPELLADRAHALVNRRQMIVDVRLLDADFAVQLEQARERLRHRVVGFLKFTVQGVDGRADRGSGRRPPRGSPARACAAPPARPRAGQRTQAAVCRSS